MDIYNQSCVICEEVINRCIENNNQVGDEFNEFELINVLVLDESCWY